MNTSYVFAVGGSDATGKIIGSIGQTTTEIVPLFPLPILQCWAQLALTAHSLANIFSFFLISFYESLINCIY